VVETLAAFVEPVGVDAWGVQWLNEFILRAAIVQSRCGASTRSDGRVTRGPGLVARRSSRAMARQRDAHRGLGPPFEVVDDKRDLGKGRFLEATEPFRGLYVAIFTVSDTG
jgi:hypothetical protein